MNISIGNWRYSHAASKVSIVYNLGRRILTFVVHEDTSDTPNDRLASLEGENAVLLRKVATLERELQCLSPTKTNRTKPAQISATHTESHEEEILRIREMDLNEYMPPVKTPGRRIRKLTPKAPTFIDENFDLFSSP